jgi:UDP-N-acetylmuramoyl-L-alanyl-D-glutamate--2,6-diaminopimelate ligase
MTVLELFQAAGVSPAAAYGDAEITSIVSDSRKSAPGALFVCMPSRSTDSHTFIPDAVAAGAVAALLHDPSGLGIAERAHLPAFVVPDEGYLFNETLCRLCDAFFEHPTRHMRVVGVTGTNGKTTTAWLIRDMLRELGVRAGYLGTLGIHLPEDERSLANTTPFPIEYFTLLAEARDAGVEALAMEVSSHALAQRRVDLTEFDVAIFTNLTQDHLDFHGTMEAYEEAKLRLFGDLADQSAKPFSALLNLDDPVGERWFRRLARESDGEVRQTVGFGLNHPDAELVAVPRDVRVDGISMELRFRGSTAVAESGLGGAYNVENLLAATAGLLALGYDLAQLEPIYPRLRPVPGRFEPVHNDSGIGVIVDYAHTPDALEKLLAAVRPLTRGRVITVFGCGGDRDRSKRPKMARAASRLSDVTVVTSDNPRTEPPEQIIAEIVQGFESGAETRTEPDRSRAIALALDMAHPGDVVVIAGKGHENYQIVGQTKISMDDRELARAALRERGASRQGGAPRR